MKLSIPLINGQVLIYEGTYDELVKIGEEFVARAGGLVASNADAAQLAAMQAVPANNSRRWTDSTARRLLSLLYGDQAKLVELLLQKGGAVKYADIEKQLGLGAQKLAGVLSSLTRNAQKATGDRLARLVDWRLSADGKQEYYIDPNALPLLAVAKKP